MLEQIYTYENDVNGNTVGQSGHGQNTCSAVVPTGTGPILQDVTNKTINEMHCNSHTVAPSFVFHGCTVNVYYNQPK